MIATISAEQMDSGTGGMSRMAAAEWPPDPARRLAADAFGRGERNAVMSVQMEE
ncbi:hypothetical protein KTD17_27705 [Burkholderia multivorans]|uniref:hypothetical protein n=1 Tax=Burkholderia multivorans TaxID=87883 RepID=UPI001C2361E6|nr:hypothetical protein [Burkholderia multivorans]MBU9136800.1 hypothetical protein [Burkholderia multivorans]